VSTGEIVRREEYADALSQILGTGDTRSALAQVERNVKDVIEVCRDRGFVQRYGDSRHEFFGLPAWQLLAMTYGLVPFVEWTRPIDNGWEARAVVRTRDGSEVGAAEAMCTRTEPNRKNAKDHDLRAMAQTRANRNALRSCLGAALVLAGFDFPDPDAPATTEQVGLLHQLERAQGFSHDRGHELAGVGSYRDLTREQAATLIDTWSETGASEEPGGSPDPSPPSPGEAEAVRTSPASSDAPATPEQFARAEQMRISKAVLLKRAREAWPDAGLRSTSDLTHAQLDHLLSQGVIA
jgi:hypothetical protein